MNVQTPSAPNPSDSLPRPAVAPHQPDAAKFSGVDGPTSRLAVRDLAVILEILDRLDQIEPELKAQMLRELAEADAKTVAVIVREWRDKLVVLEGVADKIRAASADERAQAHPAPLLNPVIVQPAVASPTALPEPLAPPGVEPETWDNLLQSLIDQAHARAQGSDPEATRARVQLALLELLRKSEPAAQHGARPDLELCNRLTPAIELCLRASPANRETVQIATQALVDAIERLRGPARLGVRNLNFCKRIHGYGNVEPMDAASFSPSHHMLLYSEVENFSSEPVGGGLRTKLSSELELLSGDGQTVWSQRFGSVEDRSSVVRRDYFMSHSFRLPSDLKPGVYSVQLTLCDELSGQSASSEIRLTIR